jgi:FKBP-type peptidyl-prolyl cis-trans isomerase SlyD
MRISSGKVVFFDYTLTDSDKEIIDSSRGGEPLGYVHGAGQIVPGLEKALEGRSAGDAFSVVVEPAEGYGLSDPANIVVIPASQIEAVDELAVGTQLEAEGGQTVIVTKIEGDQVTIDGNHPLAGITLYFDVTVREVREADPAEIAHGHVHGAGGHHH